MAISRRRFITVAGASAALAGFGFGVRPAHDAPLVAWRGYALGAEATIMLHHESPVAARRLIESCRAEIRRLESHFSLYDPESSLCRLNATGRLDDPSPDFLRLLADCRRFHEATDGAFDPSVQPIWTVYATHFRTGNSADGPPPTALAAAHRLVGFGAVGFGSASVTFGHPGMALTFNGIAQGYITDRVADLLRDSGITDTLVSLGETRVLGRHPTGRDWRIALDDGDDAPTLSLANAAVATSAGAASPFEPSGRHHHLFDPTMGRSTTPCRSVSVVAARATTADATSTALAVLPTARAADVLKATGARRALITRTDGRRLDHSAVATDAAAP